MFKTIRSRTCAAAAAGASLLAAMTLLAGGPAQAVTAASGSQHVARPASRAASSSPAHPSSPGSASASASSSAGRPAQTAGADAKDIRRVCAAPKRDHAACMALLRTNVRSHKGVRPDQAPLGYGPSDFQSAYDLPSSSGGGGQTVAVVDAYNDPDIASDLATYRAQYGLPSCTEASGCFQVVNEEGQPSPLPPNAGTNGWDVEESLDVDMVSAICPNCHIILVEADSNDNSDLYTAEDEAVALGAKYVSNSWGECEYSGETADDEYFNHPGVAITVAGGDYGYDNYLEGCDSPNYPAASQYVTSVGGTTLTQDSSVPRGWTEATWSPDPDATGSGCSLYEPKPSWQTDTGCANRMTNDVSADADPATGAAVYDSYSEGGWLEVGGTSEATPIIAATYALAGTPASGTYPSSYPYAIPSALNDITSGSNYDSSCTPAYSCTAGLGYDGPTGLGTPDGVVAFSSAHGDISGRVTSQATGAPVAGATVSTSQGYTATTNASGDYELGVPPGGYDLTASAFGYQKLPPVTGVTVTNGQTVTENFTLATAPEATLSGTVTGSSGHPWPLYAKITIPGDPDVAYSDPYTGGYSLSLPQRGTYQLQVTPVDLPGYAARDLRVHVGTAGLVKNITVAVDGYACDAAAGYAPSSSFIGTTQAFTGWSGSTPQDGWTVTDNEGNGETWNFSNPGDESPPPGGDADFAIADSTIDPVGDIQDTSLTSPVLNLSSLADPQITFDDYSWGYTNGTNVITDVDVSLDGGATWTTVWSPGFGPVSGLITIPIPQAAGQPDVQVRFHYTAGGADATANSGYWEIDNVSIGGYNCDPVRGGLVAGQVTDANTGDAVDGATVTSVASTAETATTADSPGAGDGFYELFAAGTGHQKFTAAGSDYAPATGTAAVTANAVDRQDFTLQAGKLAVAATGLSASVALGKTATRTLRLRNTGTQPLRVSLTQVDNGYSAPGSQGPARAAGAPLEQVKAHLTRGFAQPRTRSAAPAAGARRAAPADASWTGIADYPTPVYDNAVAYDASTGEVYSVGGFNGTEDTAAGYVYDPAAQQWTAIPDSPAVTQAARAAVVGGTLYLIGGWDAAGDATSTVYAYDIAAGTWSQAASLPAGLAAGGVAVLDGQIYMIGGCVDADCDETASVYRYDPASNAWSQVADYPVLIGYQACAGISGQVVCAGGSSGSGGLNSSYLYDPAAGTWTAGAAMPFTDWGMASGGASGQLQIVGGTTNNTTVTNQAAEYDVAAGTWALLPGANLAEYRGGGACGLYQIGGVGGSGLAAQSYAEVLPGYAQCGGTVPWLSESSTSIELPAHASASVTVTLDSAGLTEPGTYTASLAVGTNTPYQNQPVTVTFQVNPPTRWAQLTGTVTDAATGDPLAGATVQVCTRYDKAAGTCGAGSASYTLTTGDSGTYQLWLADPSADNPVQVIVARPGYQPRTEVVKVARDTVTTLNVALSEASASSVRRERH